MRLNQNIFGLLPDGKTAELFTLANDQGMEVRITNYGGIVVSLSVPDRNGRSDDVVLGYDTLAEYLHFTPYFGAIIGRFAGPLFGAHFYLDGIEYPLAANEGKHHLHGGIRGFDKVLWKAEAFEKPTEVGVRLSYLSPHGEEGYPGNLTVTTTYRLTHANEFQIDYEASTDQSTILNLTHHGYFNLAGQGQGTIQDHEIRLAANWFNLIDKDLVPTGEVAPVQGTPFDFNRAARLGDRMRSDHVQVRLAGGFDQNWLLDISDGSLQTVARVSEPTTGRVMEMATTEPGFQFYTSNVLPEGTAGKKGRIYGKWSALCLEAQRYPPWPDRPSGSSHILRPGERYTQRTLYRFP